MKKQEEEDDSTIKLWFCVPRLQQKFILPGGVWLDDTVTIKTTKFMATVSGCQNGTQVDQCL